MIRMAVRFIDVEDDEALGAASILIASKERDIEMLRGGHQSRTALSESGQTRREGAIGQREIDDRTNSLPLTGRDERELEARRERENEHVDISK